MLTVSPTASWDRKSSGLERLTGTDSSAEQPLMVRPAATIHPRFLLFMARDYYGTNLNASQTPQASRRLGVGMRTVSSSSRMRSMGTRPRRMDDSISSSTVGEKFANRFMVMVRVREPAAPCVTRNTWYSPGLLAANPNARLTLPARMVSSLLMRSSQTTRYPSST